jgi:hypothetical protein
MVVFDLNVGDGRGPVLSGRLGLQEAGQVEELEPVRHITVRPRSANVHLRRVNAALQEKCVLHNRPGHEGAASASARHAGAAAKGVREERATAAVERALAELRGCLQHASGPCDAAPSNKNPQRPSGTSIEACSLSKQPGVPSPRGIADPCLLQVHLLSNENEPFYVSGTWTTATCRSAVDAADVTVQPLHAMHSPLSIVVRRCQAWQRMQAHRPAQSLRQLRAACHRSCHQRQRMAARGHRGGVWRASPSRRS